MVKSICEPICKLPSYLEKQEFCHNDPVKPLRKIQLPKTVKKPKCNFKIEPPLEIRIGSSKPTSSKYGYCSCNISVLPRKSKSCPKLSDDINVVRVASPLNVRITETIARFNSPEVIGPRVRPRRPSVTSHDWPDEVADSQLKLHKPKSGIIIRDSAGTTLLDRLSIGYDRPFAIDLINKYGLFDTLSLGLGEENTLEPEVIRNILDILEQEEVKESKSKDVVVQTDGSEKPAEEICSEAPEVLSKWVQSLRIVPKPPSKVPPRHTLESHSFTNIVLSSKIVKEYKYGIKLASYDQSDPHFSERTRNCQTLANLICAYCLSFIKHPCEWSSQDLDDVLECGDKLYGSTLDYLQSENVTGKNLLKNVMVGDKNFVFEITDPVIVGLTKSDDPRVYNLLKGLSIFFHKYSCALLESQDLQLILWKCRFYYLFDPHSRAKDLYPDPEGAAAIISFFDLKTIVSMLIERSGLQNQPFKLSRVCILKILNPASSFNTGDSLTSKDQEYKILSDTKAVITGSFSMADPCFEWTINKQALPMSLMALIYTRITPPPAWSRRILDKILILGNQLLSEIVSYTNRDNLELNDIPGIMSLGPYRISITILESVIKGYILCSKNCPNLLSGLEFFFKNSTSGIIQFDKYTYGIWKFRNFYYMFDPFPRDYEGHMKINGTALVSMMTSLDIIKEMLMMNLDPGNNCPFYIHALKDVKIYLDSKNGTRLISIDPCETALVEFKPNTIPSGSNISIGSSVMSLGDEFIPKLLHKHSMPNPEPLPRPSKASIGMVDLDSASLSDTQITPARPQIVDYELSTISDDFYITNSLLDLLVSPEGEELQDEIFLDMKEFEKKMIDELGYGEGEERMEATSVQTELEGFRILRKHVLHPPRLPEPEQPKPPHRPLPIQVPEVTQSEEIRKDTNFVPMPDGTELIQGSDSIASYKPVSLISPFVAIMAVVVAKKYSFVTWDASILDYIVRCGFALYGVTEQRFDEAAVHEFKRIGLGSTEFTAKSTYILDSVYKQRTMEQILNTLFKRVSSAILVNPNYSCAVFYKNFLFYLFDPYNSNAVGFGYGGSSEGACCFIRFTNCHQLVARILHNKFKREQDLGHSTTRYVLSIVEVHRIPPDEIVVTDEVQPEPPVNTLPSISSTTNNSISGYQFVNNQWVIYGTDRLRGRNEVTEDRIKPCHFVSLAALLLLMLHPIDTWDSRLVDYALKLGTRVFSYAERKNYYQKRLVNNIILEKFKYDVVIQLLEYPLAAYHKNLDEILGWYMRGRNFLMLQFPSMCMALYMDGEKYHLFDPYKFKHEKARWMRFDSRLKAVRYVEDHVPCFGLATYYTFCVTSIRKASPYATMYSRSKPVKIKEINHRKPFNEREEWLDVDPIPWSRLQCCNACGDPRGEQDSMWKDWDIEITNDLWSLWGTLHQKSNQFQLETRGKQTICNCIVCCVVTQIYDLSEWNPILLDSILKNGDQYYIQSIRKNPKISEFNVEDLIPEVVFHPFKAEIVVTPVVEGTMYVLRSYQFNLYKALGYFFHKRDSRLGLIFVNKRILAFGKIREGEFFLYDCASYGAPLFLDKQGCSYILRMTSLNRLVHTMTLTLREGDFYIYDVEVHKIQKLKK